MDASEGPRSIDTPTYHIHLPQNAILQEHYNIGKTGVMMVYLQTQNLRQISSCLWIRKYSSQPISRMAYDKEFNSQASEKIIPMSQLNIWELLNALWQMGFV